MNGAGEQLDNLGGTVEAMNLDKKLADDLQAKLAVPAKKLDNPKEACNAMNDFPVTVIDEAGKKTPRITIPQAQTLTGRAVRVEGALGCIPPGSPIGDAAHDLLDLMQTIDGLGLKDGETERSHQQGGRRRRAPGRRQARPTRARSSTSSRRGSTTTPGRRTS